MKKIYYVLGFYTLLFVTLFFKTLSINYVEGDDATGILYHLCGRDINIQKPYSCYNSGFDFFLNFLNNNEVLLRNFSIVTSFIFGFLVLVFLAMLIELVTEKITSNLKYYILTLLPFIIPDFIFSSLIVNSTNVSFAFALLSSVFYLKFLKQNKKYFLILSIILMAVSIPFRWSNLVYYPVFLSILIYFSEFEIKKISKQIPVLLLFYISSIILGILFIYVSGYDFKTLLETIIWGKQYMDSADKALVSNIAIATSFFTIPLVMLLFFGFIFFFKNSKNKILGKILFVVLPLIPYLILGFFIAYKYMITVVPILTIICLIGFIEINNKKLKYTTKI